MVELLVLQLLVARGDLHGYAIVKELLSLGPVIAGESTVYPVLRRLQSDDLLASRWVEAANGPPRKYYTVTEDGAQFLADALGEWEALVQSVEHLKGEDRSG